MNVKVENVEKNVVKMEIEVDKETFEKGMDKSYRKNLNKFNVPGFRKGKAPRKLIENYYGENVLYEDAINAIFPEAYEQAIKENDIHPVSEPEIDIIQIGSGQSLIFTATVTVKPEVELGEYTGIEVKTEEINITDEDVNNELKRIAEDSARLINVDDKEIQKGDIAIIDFEGLIDGQPFEDGKRENVYLEIGSEDFLQGFDEQLLGAKAGDELEVKATFPEDYNDSALAGKEALFKVKIKGLKIKEIPAIDDEFAKDVSEFDTVEEFKNDLKNKLIERKKNLIKRKTEDEIINKVVENAKVDIPQPMIDKRIDFILQNINLRLAYQNLTLDDYLSMKGQNIEELRKEYQDAANVDVKTQLVLDKIGEVEGINITEEEIEEEIKKYAQEMEQSYEDYKQNLSESTIDYIKSNIKRRKVIEFLVNNAKFVEK